MKKFLTIKYSKVRDKIFKRIEEWRGKKGVGGVIIPGIGGIMKLHKTKKFDTERLRGELEEANCTVHRLYVAPLKGGRGKYILWYLINFKEAEDVINKQQQEDLDKLKQQELEELGDELQTI